MSQQTDKKSLEETNSKDKSPIIQDVENKLKRNTVSVKLFSIFKTNIKLHICWF